MQTPKTHVNFHLIGYVVASVILFLYSFPQVDLNLTLSRASVWTGLQKVFLQIGYYERPLSTAIFVSILAAFFLLYWTVIRKAAMGLLSFKQIWILIIAVVAILLLSYPAFSYDFFNYMFTAKTVLVYEKNPYEVIPLQFAGFDPYLNFMHWTHLPSAYGPVWIAMTLPFYLMGFGYFLVTLWNFKLLIAGFYILAVVGIERIVKEFNKKEAALGVVIFALNPLVIVESLVSAHNDVVMMAVALWAIYYLLKKRYYLAFFLLSLSVAFKLMTIVLLPLFLYVWWKKDIKPKRLFLYCAMSLVAALFFVIFKREVLPWYFVWVVPFVALMPKRTGLIFLTVGASVGLLLRYAPFIYYGNYEVPTVIAKFWVTIVPIMIAAVFTLLLYGKKID